MQKNTKKGIAVNDVIAPTNNTTFSIEIYQQGEFLKKEKDGTIHTIKVERKQTSLILDFEISNDFPTMGKFVGRVIDLLIANNKFDFFVKNKVFTSKLDLCFAIHFNNAEFNGTKFFQVKPNFFKTKNNITNFYRGFTLFVASVNGLYKPFSFESNLDAKEVINGYKNLILQKDYERINANSFIEQQITELLN